MELFNLTETDEIEDFFEERNAKRKKPSKKAILNMTNSRSAKYSKSNSFFIFFTYFFPKCGLFMKF